MSGNKISVGFGIFVVNRANQILVGQRLKSGLFGLPGGGLEFGETIESGAQRELKEETGLIVPLQEFRCFRVFNTIRENYHAIDFCVHVRMPDDQEPVNVEPDICAGWKFVDWNALYGLPLFYPLKIEANSIEPPSYDNLPSSIFTNH